MTPQAEMMSLDQSISGWAKSHATVIETAAVAVALFLTMTDVATGGFEATQRPPNALAYVLLVGQILPFVFRRRYPFAVMYLMVSSLGLYWILNYPAGADAAGLVAIYSAVVYGANRRTTWAHASVGIVAMTVIASLLSAGFFIDDDAISAFVVFAVVALHLAAAVFGEVVHQLQQRSSRLQARATMAEAEADTRARLAVIEERTRIAREMHDVVAHGMSVISVQAAAAQEIALSNPDRTIGILQDIEATGREALTEMRRMLGVLRSGDDTSGSLSPQPSLTDLNSAIARCVEAGLPTKLVLAGRQQRLSPGLELAAFRITQEALTNALKHAGDSATATVALDYRPTELGLTITDTGRGAVSALTNGGSGHGLIGMRERVDAYNGQLTAGPIPGGGYQVMVVLPLDQEAARPGITSAEAPEADDRERLI